MKNHKSLLFIIISSPFILWTIIQILPTFDDWTYFTNPYYDFGNSFWNMLIPRESYWRPFDCFFGYILSFNDKLFPTLNHIAVYAGHIANTLMLWIISNKLGLSSQSKEVTTIFFFMSPAVLGTVLGIDSLNQVYSHLWGMIAIYVYLSGGKARYLWLICALIATFCKENGMVYFIIPQMIAYTFGKTTMKRSIYDTLFALVLIIVYFVARIALSTDTAEIKNEYYDNPIARTIKNIVKFVITTFVISDYSLLLYKPIRNIPLAIMLALFILPFYIYIILKSVSLAKTRKLWLLAFCVITAASPHLVTLFTVMHAYAAFGIICIIWGLMYEEAAKHNSKTAKTLLIAFLAASIVIDWHHIELSRKSGEIGKRMALSVVQRITPNDSVSVLYIDRGEEKYSSFCVIPYDAFGWGAAIRLYGNNGKPRYIDNETFMSGDIEDINKYADNIVKQGFKQVLLVKGDTIDIIRQ